MKKAKVLTSSLLAVALMVSPTVAELSQNEVRVEASSTTSFMAKQDTKLFKTKHQKSTVLLSVKKGTSFKSVKKLGSWSEVAIGTKKGYVPTSHIQSQSTMTTQSVKKKTNRTTDLKSSRSTKAKTIVQISTGKEVTEVKQIGSWTEISYGQYKGYVPTRNLSSIISTNQVKTKTNRTTDLKSSRSTKGKTTVRISKGKEVVVLKEWGSWTEISYGKYKGFVPKRNLNPFTSPTGSVSPPTNPVVDNGKMRTVAQIQANLKSFKHPENNNLPMFNERSYYGERIFGYKSSESKREAITVSANLQNGKADVHLTFSGSEVYALDNPEIERNFKLVLRHVADAVYPKGSKNADAYYNFSIKHLEMIVSHYEKYKNTLKLNEVLDSGKYKIGSDEFEYHNAVLNFRISFYEE